MPHHSLVVVAPVRTAIGTFGGSLKEIPTPGLGAVAIKAPSHARGSIPRFCHPVQTGWRLTCTPRRKPAEPELDRGHAAMARAGYWYCGLRKRPRNRAAAAPIKCARF
jgi:hypothetical protein